jgi:hypothetical protein
MKRNYIWRYTNRKRLNTTALYNPAAISALIHFPKKVGDMLLGCLIFLSHLHF